MEYSRIIEPAPTFELPNQFLVWVAQKFIARSDLDLLLTEYYKERLEPRLKNETETRTTDYKSTESTELTGLRLPTDWTSHQKLSPAKLFSLTPPPSPLSLPLSYNFSAPLVSSHNPSCLHLDSERNVHSSLTVGIMEQSSKQGVEGEVTPTGSYSSKALSKDPSSASIPMYSRAVMPYLGLPGAPFFEGSNITDFLDSYSRMCTDYQVDEQEKIKRLSWYCELFTGKYIETLISSSGTSWAALRKALREEYKDQDLNQQMNSRRFLEVYKSKSRSETADVLQYCRQFSAISRNLVAKRKLDTFTQSRWFIQGLPSHLQTEMFYRYELDPDDDVNMDFDNLLKKAMGLLGAKKKLASLVQVEKESQGVEDLVEKCDLKTRINSTPGPLLTQAPMPAYPPPIRSAPTSVQASGGDYRPVDRKIDHLTEMMKGLALSVRTLQNTSGLPAENNWLRLPATESSNLSQPVSSPSLQSGWPEGVTRCSYCWAPDHYLKRYCQVFQDDLNSNRIHLGDNRKVCLGPYTPGARHVFMRQGKSGRESVADAEKLRYLSLPSANVQTLRIGDADPDPYSSDEEAQYVCLDEPIETGVLAARGNQPKPTQGPSKEPVKRILRRRIEKENNYAAPKNVRFGEWEPVKDTSVPAPISVPVSAPNLSQEATMPDAEAGELRKTVERKKHPRVVNVLKESVGTTTITKRILDLGVNLTVGELLASAPAVEKQLTKAITEDEAMQFRVNTLESSTVDTRNSHSWYSMGSPKAKVRLEDGCKVTALLDTGAEINVMTREVMEDASLAMRRGPKLELVSHTGHSRPFLGLCEEVEVAIGGLKTRHPIFVVEQGDHDLVLGQSFLNSVKFSQEYKPDGIFGIITHPQTQQSAVFRTLAPNDPANRNENQIFSQSLN